MSYRKDIFPLSFSNRKSSERQSARILTQDPYGLTKAESISSLSSIQQDLDTLYNETRKHCKELESAYLSQKKRTRSTRQLFEEIESDIQRVDQRFSLNSTDEMKIKHILQWIKDATTNIVWERQEIEQIKNRLQSPSYFAGKLQETSLDLEFTKKELKVYDNVLYQREHELNECARSYIAKTESFKLKEEGLLTREKELDNLHRKHSEKETLLETRTKELDSTLNKLNKEIENIETLRELLEHKQQQGNLLVSQKLAELELKEQALNQKCELISQDKEEQLRTDRAELEFTTTKLYEIQEKLNTQRSVLDLQQQQLDRDKEKFIQLINKFEEEGQQLARREEAIQEEEIKLAAKEQDLNTRESALATSR